MYTSTSALDGVAGWLRRDQLWDPIADTMGLQQVLARAGYEAHCTGAGTKALFTASHLITV